MAITVDFGVCEQCTERNSKAASVCRKCGAPLPWSNLAKKSRSSLQNSSVNSVTTNVPKTAAPSVSRGFLTKCAGGLLFLGVIAYLVARVTGNVPFIPFLTYGLLAGGAALWKAGSNMAD